MKLFKLSTVLFLVAITVFSSCKKDDDTPTPEPQLSNTEKAVAILQAIQSGDVTAMQDNINQTTYMQHNLSYPDGVAALIGAVQSGAFTGTTIETVRSFEDDNIVVLHSKYAGTWNNDTAQAVFDVFRFENGLAVEHWDNLANVQDDGDGTTQFDGGLTPASNLPETKANRTVVTTMIQKIFLEGLYSTADTYFDTVSFVQHSVNADPNIQGLLGFFAFLGEGNPLYSSSEFIHVQGNFALTMSQGFPDTTSGLSTAYYDLFRLENGKIVEHWDIVQLIPAPADWANTNGKF